MNFKGERYFIENFCALAYFKIPDFRHKLLSCLIKKEDSSFEEIKDTDFHLETNNFEDKKNKYFMSLFDWEKDFYVYLEVKLFCIFNFLIIKNRIMKREKLIKGNYRIYLVQLNGSIDYKKEELLSSFSLENGLFVLIKLL